MYKHIRRVVSKNLQKLKQLFVTISMPVNIFKSFFKWLNYENHDWFGITFALLNSARYQFDMKAQNEICDVQIT